MFKKVALLIDSENVPAGLWPEIFKTIGAFGEIGIGMVIADFSGNRCAGWQKLGVDFGLDLVQQSGTGKGKNACDMALTIRAMDLLHTGRFDAFCVVSSDNDFSPLALRVRQAGLHCMGIGEAKSSVRLRNCFDSYFVVGKKVTKPVPIPPESAYLTGLIQRLCAQSDEDGSISISKAAVALRSEQPVLAARLKNKFSKTLQKVDSVEIYGTGNTMRVRLKVAKAA